MVNSDHVETTVQKLLISPAVHQDPYDQLAFLLRSAPAHYSDLGYWVISGYDQCSRLLRDPRVGMDLVSLRRWWRFTDTQLQQHESYQRGHRSSLHMHNPPEHSRLRQFFGADFGLRSVRGRTPAIRAVIDAVIEELASAERADLLARLAIPVTTRVIGRLMGIPDSLASSLFPLVLIKNLAFEPRQDGTAVQAANRARNLLEGHFRALLEHKRRHPADDILTKWTTNNVLALDDDEITSNAALVFAAAVDTAAQVICTGVWELLRRGIRQPPLDEDGGVSGTLVNELLRHSGPVMLSPRTALDDLALDEHGFARGDLIVLLLGAANRDPRRFTQPDLLLPDRAEGMSLAFGKGAHQCLGTALALLEVRLTLGRLLTRFPNISVEEPPSYDRFTIRGLQRLTVKLQS